MDAEIAQARIAVYRFLLAALDRPSPEQHAWMRAPDFRQTLDALCDTFAIDCPEEELVPEDAADHESRYLACFEVGVPEPPVVLFASHYNRREPAQRVVHEHVLLYRAFGVTLPPGSLDSPDSLFSQLAFLLRLDELLLGDAVEGESVLRARRDFLARHVVRWVGHAAALAEEKHLPPVYCVLLAALSAALVQDSELSTAALTAVSQETA